MPSVTNKTHSNLAPPLAGESEATQPPSLSTLPAARLGARLGELRQRTGQRVTSEAHMIQ